MPASSETLNSGEIDAVVGSQLNHVPVIRADVTAVLPVHIRGAQDSIQGAVDHTDRNRVRVLWITQTETGLGCYQ